MTLWIKEGKLPAGCENETIPQEEWMTFCRGMQWQFAFCEIRSWTDFCIAYCDWLQFISRSCSSSASRSVVCAMQRIISICIRHEWANTKAALLQAAANGSSSALTCALLWSSRFAKIWIYYTYWWMMVVCSLFILGHTFNSILSGMCVSQRYLSGLLFFCLLESVGDDLF